VNPKFHRYAILVSISALILIAIGAYITSQATGRQPDSRGLLDGVIHKYVAFTVGALVVALAYWQSLHQEVSLLIWIASGLLALEGWVGWLGMGFLHASLAPVVFAIFVAIIVVTSRGWNDAPQPAEDTAAPRLRRFAIATPVLLLLQIMLGAAYRHKLLGILPHLGGAMIVSIATVALPALILQRHPEHRKLRTAATLLISTLGAQVFLGFAALIMPQVTSNAIASIVATASHVVVGSLVLAASVVLAIEVQRDVRPAPAEAVVDANSASREG
jgi:heme A synthase